MLDCVRFRHFAAGTTLFQRCSCRRGGGMRATEGRRRRVPRPLGPARQRRAEGRRGQTRGQPTAPPSGPVCPPGRWSRIRAAA